MKTQHKTVSLIKAVIVIARSRYILLLLGYSCCCLGLVNFSIQSSRGDYNYIYTFDV